QSLICAATHHASMSDHSTDGHSTGARASATLLSPFQKLQEQGFPLLIGGPPHACAVQERLEILASGGLAADQLCQLLFGSGKPAPTRDCRGEIDVTPLGRERRLPQLFPILEQLDDEALDLAVSIAVLRPIVGSQDERHGKRVNTL